MGFAKQEIIFIICIYNTANPQHYLIIDTKLLSVQHSNQRHTHAEWWGQVMGVLCDGTSRNSNKQHPMLDRSGTAATCAQVLWWEQKALQDGRRWRWWKCWQNTWGWYKALRWQAGWCFFVFMAPGTPQDCWSWGRKHWLREGQSINWRRFPLVESANLVDVLQHLIHHACALNLQIFFVE